MKPALMLASCTFLALQIGTAAAGPCTGEIESLSKILAAKDAGSGPTATTNPGQHPPTAAMSAADPSSAASSTTAAKSNQPQQPPTAAMTRAATNLDAGTAAAKPREQHPPTAAMDQAAHGSAAAGAPGKARDDLDSTHPRRSSGRGISTRPARRRSAWMRSSRRRSCRVMTATLRRVNGEPALAHSQWPHIRPETAPLRRERMLDLLALGDDFRGRRARRRRRARWTPWWPGSCSPGSSCRRPLPSG